MLMIWEFEQEGYAIHEEEYSFKFYPFKEREIIGVKPDAPQWAKDEYEDYVRWKKEQDEILRISYRDMLEKEECTIENGLKVLKPNASQKAKEKYEEYLEKERQRKVRHEKELEEIFSEPMELIEELTKLTKFKDITLKDGDPVLKPNASQEAKEACERFLEWEKNYYGGVKKSEQKLSEEEQSKASVQKKHTDVFAPLFKLFKKIFP